MSTRLAAFAVLAASSVALAQVEIHPGGYSDDKCLDVQGAVFANGTPVQLYDCNGSAAQQWEIQSGNTAVRLNGTDFCLDAGSTPGNGVQMKIWQCFDGLAAQEWFYTDDNRIALTNQGLCLDLPSGNTADGTVLQTWQCTDGDINQIWITSAGATPPPPPANPPAVAQIHPNGNSAKCLDVRGAEFADGTPVQVYDCNGTPSQNWNFARGGTHVQLNGTNFCLDAGSGEHERPIALIPRIVTEWGMHLAPADGVGMKIWDCYDGLAAQEWNYTETNTFALSGSK
ncbi:hypothetical protein EIP86_007370 [Pleurotus ostreatoroseus]|nr:hypothetical protein EIP86_007370 [Pleurotus ostreatoroseus]